MLLAAICLLSSLGRSARTQGGRVAGRELGSGLAGLALWWIDHAHVPKPVMVEGAARMSGSAVGAAST